MSRAGSAGVDAGLHNNLLRIVSVRGASSRRRVGRWPCRAGKKNAAGWPREYSQTPSDEGNKQL
ncbi:hypothetical protein C6Q14_20185 [Burkholderia ambifaria]|nr:hypothetical protein C6Q14_20185 [Burkholderia ambifaria]